MDDSQLSDIIREGKLCHSQNKSQVMTQNLSDSQTQELDTTPSLLFSQGTAQILDNYNGISSDNSIFQNMSIYCEESSQSERQLTSDIFNVPVRPHDARRRTEKLKIQENPPPSIPPYVDLNELYEGNTQDRPNESLDLMDITVDSELTVVQQMMGSQNISILVQKSPRRKERDRAMRLMKEKGNEVQRSCAQGSAIPLAPISHHRYTMRSPDLFESYDRSNDEEILFGEPQTVEEEPEVQQLKLNVPERPLRISDFAYSPHDEKQLWAKIGVDVPIEVEWTIASKYKRQRLALRVRLVAYDRKRMRLENAIRDPNMDAVKCRNHTEQESGIPPESYFYIKDVQREWVWSSPQEKAIKGNFTQTYIAPGETEAKFDITFRCKAKCMEIEERRKKMCLVVSLIDKNGNEIVSGIIDWVRVVGYPQRDLKAYDKNTSEGKYAKTEDLFKNLPTPSFMIASSSADKEEKMFPSLSANRKRPLSDDSAMDVDEKPEPSKSMDYTHRLHNCPVPKKMVDIVKKEYNAPSKKRSRHSDYKKLVLPGRVYEKTIALLDNYVRSASLSAKDDTTRPNPVLASTKLSEDMSIERFVSLFSEQDKDKICFKNRGLESVTDLMRAYKLDPHFFETIGLDSEKATLYFETFFYFYIACENKKMSKKSSK